MKHIFLLAVFSFIIGGRCWAISIHDLLDAAEQQPNNDISELAVQESALQKERSMVNLFPKIGLFGRFESYNSPTNLRPMTPTEVNVQAGNSIPFSREILRYGLSFDAPVYIHELYVLNRKTGLLHQKAQIDRQLDLLGRQAAVVSLNSAFTYFWGLEKSIDARQKSLNKTLEDIALKVKVGRSSESDLLKIQKTLNELNQQRNELAVKRLDTLREIYTLTGIELTEPVPMILEQKPEGTSYLPVTAAQYNADAAQTEIERRKATRYPTLSLTGFLSGNEGNAYNTDSHIDRSYNEIAIVLKVPLFDRSLDVDKTIAGIQAQKAQKQLAQTWIDMAALADALEKKIPIIEKSADIARKSISDSQTLLAVAQVSVRSGRMTLEDYLRYESDVLSAQAVLYQTLQQLWQSVSQQAVLYGTNLKGVVK